MRLRPREDRELPRRLALSADCTQGLRLRTEDFDGWLAERAAAHPFRVRRIPFRRLRGWRFAPRTGNLVHDSGRFFSVEGLHVRWPAGRFPEWHQPIIVQPEIGILGILAKEFDGVLHFLMQAKMEPGNPRLLQLSPTVQATRSNYTRVHKGSAVRYLEYFTGRRPGRVIVDALQSEHGAWFHGKRNRNVVVEVTEDVPLADDFCWLTLGQLNQLLARDNVVNMDSRTVLAHLPAAAAPRRADRFREALAASCDPEAGALWTTAEVLSWFTGMRAECELRAGRVPLEGLPGWYRGEDEIARDDGRFFRVVAVDVRAGSREVAAWTQPLIQPCGLGVAAFVVRDFGGVLHVLVHAKAEAGLGDGVELAPTVQCAPDNYRGMQPPPFLEQVTDAGPERIRYQAIHAEEGGRFLAAENRYLIVEADERVPDSPPHGYAWVTVGQLAELVRHGRYLNVQARTLLACLHSMR
ncbi:MULTISPECIES: NDP-hexose 2,3-dehydratase family protein [Thermomonospora]|uniref:NDP-hexose 23-dehydratase n=1 Tax=Thermomonospora curvata (strain ATCC 19995 / DSM 43183 / JCM 3096 / KCTC 9072 / NBRC 15933 / NCIMB 10081 / Henssen B9) TaxID=471852 RepID=D1A611_THECD|nr:MULTISPECIES: NDP-hexose 2,3-dehydratase family protein [Thermomonospora]ACY98306.1 NDP-hexose 23-dehydratase [Thermomonospora curvata DSM 43183]PKK13473.1 MAG: NDP-hexose 2,3-dehydratase [Thermomonospora sp. CIF 1]